MNAKATLTIGVTLVVLVISAILFSIKGKDSSQVTVRGEKAGDIERFFTEVLPKSADWGDRISHHTLQPIRTSGREYAVKILREHSKKSLLGSCIENEMVVGVPTSTANEVLVSGTRIAYHWWYEREGFLYHVFLHVELPSGRIVLIGHEGIAD